MSARQQRHKLANELQLPRELVLACPPFRSGVNLARIVRLAGCAGLQRIIAAGNAKIDPKIARDSLDVVSIERHRTLKKCLRELKDKGYRLVALEQADQSSCLYNYHFQRRTALLIGNERQGVPDADLQLADDIVEIPVYGRPLAYNVVTATTMAVYEYCRQFPDG